MPRRNKISDLRDHLFETLEALKDTDAPMEEAPPARRLRATHPPFVRVTEDHSIWLEPMEGDECIGLCLGAGSTLAESLVEARESLATAAKQLERLERER